MKFNIFSDNLETKFWIFFQKQIDNADNYAHFLDKQTIINEKLNEYFPGLGLGFLITFNEGKKKTQIFVTAYGDKSKFHTIENLVKKSPKTKYNIIAYSPPSYLYDSLTFNGKTIATNEIEFIYKKNKNELDISFFFPKNHPTQTNSFITNFKHCCLSF